MENDLINLWCRQDECLLTACTLSLTNECSYHLLQHHPQLLPPLLVHFFVDFQPPSDVKYIIHLSRPGSKGDANECFLQYPGCHGFWSALSEFSRRFNKGSMWWYNILGYNKGSISHILRLDTITAGSILLTVKLVSLKRGNCEPILTVKKN